MTNPRACFFCNGIPERLTSIRVRMKTKKSEGADHSFEAVRIPCCGTCAAKADPKLAESNSRLTWYVIGGFAGFVAMLVGAAAMSTITGQHFQTSDGWRTPTSAFFFDFFVGGIPCAIAVVFVFIHLGRGYASRSRPRFELQSQEIIAASREFPQIKEKISAGWEWDCIQSESFQLKGFIKPNPSAEKREGSG